MSPHQNTKAWTRPTASQDRQPALVERDALAPSRRAIHLDGEANPEERREYRDEFAGDQAVDHGLPHEVRHPGPQARRVFVSAQRGVVAPHVRRDDAKERGAAQAIDDRDALAGGDRSDRLSLQLLQETLV